MDVTKLIYSAGQGLISPLSVSYYFFLTPTVACYGQIQQITNWWHFSLFSEEIGFDMQFYALINYQGPVVQN